MKTWIADKMSRSASQSSGSVGLSSTVPPFSPRACRDNRYFCKWLPTGLVVLALIAAGCGTTTTDSSSAPPGEQACVLFAGFVQDDPTTMNEDEIHSRLKKVRDAAAGTDLDAGARSLLRDDLASGSLSDAFLADVLAFSKQCQKFG